MASSSLFARAITSQKIRNLTLIIRRNTNTKSSTSIGEPSSSVTSEDQRDGLSQKNNNNSSIKPMFFNRNPRNLEKLNIARKPKGYHLDKAGHSFWHKLVLKPSKKGVAVEIIHNSGSTVLTVSTTEYGIEKFLHSSSDLSAYESLGRILAQRCLESGIHCVMCDVEAAEGTKVDQLLKAAERNGLHLTEPQEYKKPARWNARYPTKPWDIVIN